MKSFLIVFLILLTISIFVFFSSSSKPFCKDCNVILISVDTLGSNHMNLYGYNRATTPFLNEISNQSFIFKHSYSTSSYTLPSHISIFTSLYPSTHLVGKDNFDFTLSSNAVTFPQILKQNGYQTAAVVTLPYLSSYYGYNRGFDVYNEDALSNISKRNSESVNQFAFKWIDQNKDKRFFLFLHYSEPHSRWLLPADYYYLYKPNNTNAESLGISTVLLNKLNISINDLTNWNLSSDDLNELNLSQTQLQDAIAIYDGSVNFIDFVLRQDYEFLQRKHLLDKTVIIITGDHGEAFGEHYRVGHGLDLYNEEIRVPLIVLIPNSRGQVINQIASGVDIAPTILQLLNIQIPSQFQGQPLFSQQRDFVISELNSKTSVIQNSKKIIKDSTTSSTELYYLNLDPFELKNISDSSNFEKLLVVIDSFLSNSSKSRLIYGGFVNQSKFNNSVLPRLLELGYI